MENKLNTYILPDENKNKIEKTTYSSSVIIIGANGSGKTRLSSWIELNSENNIHRIVAQRKLSFLENVALKGYEASKNMVYYGDERIKQNVSEKMRWKWHDEENAVLKMLEDYNYVLSMLFAKRAQELNDFYETCKRDINEKKPIEKVPETVVDKLLYVWNKIYPHRNLSLEDGKVIVKYKDKTYKRKFNE